MNKAEVCQVVLRDATRAFDRVYTYRIPPELRDQLVVGCLAEVPFGKGNRPEAAFVTACRQLEEETPYQLKSVLRLLADRPVLRPDQIRLALHMKNRWLCSWGDALRCMVPAAVSAVREKVVRMAELIDPAEAASRLADSEISRLGQLRVIELLLDVGAAPVQEIMSACQVSRSILSTLAKNEWLRFYEQEIRRTLEGEDDYAIQEPFTPNPAQAEAIGRVSRALTSCEASLEGCQEYLLYGVTGSGKTEVYLQTAQAAVNLGRSVLILVPEIALTPQMIRRIRSRFGTMVAVLHSRLTPAERYEQWQRVLRQEVTVVVGARSAVFAPLLDIGLIIIDEEQEATYKSETHPRYHARDVARLRARDHGAVLLLGSATPSVESYQRCVSGQATLLRLPDRVGEAGMAVTEIVDMRRELADGNRSMFSRRLTQALNAAFAGGQQAIIFLNRRGFAGSVLCRNCGHIVRCRSCSVAMTTHLDRHAAEPADSKTAPVRLICHYCGRITSVPERCPACGSRLIGRFGAGTQQAETMFNALFAPAKALRMDQDTTVGRTAHERLFDQFERKGAQALIGTQMIAKGHDFPNVTVVGVLAADLMLGISDFRSSERAFQLITQAAGRAGRGTMPGTVIIQAYNIDDYAIRLAADQDYPAFFQQEIAYRSLMQYPPFAVICMVTISSLQEDEAKERCERLAEACRVRLKEEAAFAHVQMMEPARAPIYRIRSRYRYRLVIKASGHELLAAFIAPLIDGLDLKKAAIALDFDPYSML